MTWQKTRKNNDLTGAPEKVLSAALAYLAKREYSELELRGKLTARGAAEDDVAAVAAVLKEKRYLDDGRYAKAYVRDRREFRPCGAAMIRRELAARGIDAELIEEALAEEYDEEQQREALRRLLRKAAANAPDNDEAMSKYRAKIVRRMLSRGFPQSLVWDEIAILLTSADR